MNRFHIEGHVYYITTNVYKRLPIFTRPAFIIPLYDSLHFYRHQYAFKFLGYVILPYFVFAAPGFLSGLGKMRV